MSAAAAPAVAARAGTAAEAGFGRAVPIQSPRVFSSLVASFVPRHVLQEVVEITLKLVVDISTALLLGISFLVQMVSVLVSLDVALSGFCNALSAGVTMLSSSFLIFLASPIDRKTVASCITSSAFNLLWAHLMYSIDSDTWTGLCYLPLAINLLATAALACATSRLELNMHSSAALDSCVSWIFASATVTSTTLATLSHTRQAPSAALLLRFSIDTIAKCTVKVIACRSEDRSTTAQTMVDMTMALLWTTVTLHQLLLTAPLSRTKLLLLLFHDCIAVSSPTRNLLVKIMNDRYISQKFPRVTSEELRQLSSDPCPVCLSDHDESSVHLPCRHVLHSTCLSRVLQQGSRLQPSRCPMCRAALVAPASGAAGASATTQFRVGDVIRVRIIAPPTQPFAMQGGSLTAQAVRAQTSSQLPASAQGGAIRPLRNVEPAGRASGQRDGVVFRASGRDEVHLVRVNMNNVSRSNSTLEQFLSNTSAAQAPSADQPLGDAGEHGNPQPVSLDRRLAPDRPPSPALGHGPDGEPERVTSPDVDHADGAAEDVDTESDIMDTEHVADCDLSDSVALPCSGKRAWQQPTPDQNHGGESDGFADEGVEGVSKRAKTGADT